MASLLFLISLTSFVCGCAIVIRYFAWRDKKLREHRMYKGPCIYFVQLVHGHRTLVKIGRSVCPTKRIRQLRTSAPYGIKVLGVFPVEDDVRSEAIIHKMFAASRISKSNEWFKVTVPLLLYINAVSDPETTAQVRREVRGKR